MKKLIFQCLSECVDENGTQANIKCQWANSVLVSGRNMVRMFNDIHTLPIQERVEF